jgi:uncharacterized protein
VRFWDASAIVPLLVHEAATRSMQKLAERDPDMFVWWGSRIECVSALARLERAAALDRKQAALAFDRLSELADFWHEIEPTEIVRESAMAFFVFTRCGPPTPSSSGRPSRSRKAVPRRCRC